MKVWIPGVGTFEIGEGVEGAIDTLLHDDNAEKRAAAAVWLGSHGDARAFVPLQRAVVSDPGSYDEEGAFTDRPVQVADTARYALKELWSRVEPDPTDREALLALATQVTGPVKERFAELGAHAKTLVKEARSAATPEARARAFAILRGEASALDSDNEGLRIHTLAADAYTSGLYYDAMKRFAQEPSPRVRRAMADLWIRYQKRMDGRVAAGEVLNFLADQDAEVRRMIASHVVETQARVHPSKDEDSLHALAREILVEARRTHPTSTGEQNHCARKGYLVDANGVIPEDPTDLGVELLPVVGCSNIKCTRCNVKVTQEVSRSSREYRCPCSSWTETHNHPLHDPDSWPQSDPTMPWECAGHPTIELPHEVDGIQLSHSNELREVAKRVLHGWHPPGAREDDQVRVAWLRRLYVRLAPAWRTALDDTAVDCTLDPDVEIRGRALVFFRTARDPAVLAKLVTFIERVRVLFRDIQDPISPISNETLEDSLWRAVAPLAIRDGSVRQLVRDAAMTPGRGSRAVYDVLATVDEDWLVANVEQLARANRDRVDDLCASFAAIAQGSTIKTARERARAAARSP